MDATIKAKQNNTELIKTATGKMPSGRERYSEPLVRRVLFGLAQLSYDSKADLHINIIQGHSVGFTDGRP